jgi:hypothetical protein
MKTWRIYISIILVLLMATLACGSSVPQQVDSNQITQTSAETTASAPSTVIPASPQPTKVILRLEVIQSQAWTDRDGNVRTIVLYRNPYDFPVTPTFNEGASILNSAGELIRTGGLYFLDGASGGGGYFLPGETIAATSCFTCETTPLPEAWQSVNFLLTVKEDTTNWNYFTDVEASNINISFDGDSPIFWVTGIVKNNSGVMLQRISVRVFVFDEQGNLVGASEVSAWDVAAGASVDFSGYGIGQKPAGAIKFESSALAVNY